MLLLYTDEKTPKLPAKMTFSNISAKAEQKLLWKLLIINLKSSLNIEPKRAQDLWVSVFYCLKACLNKILKFWEIGNEKVVTLFFFFFFLYYYFFQGIKKLELSAKINVFWRSSTWVLSSSGVIYLLFL